MIPPALIERLDREIHGFLADLGIMEQRTDSFVDQEDIVKKFVDDWSGEADKLETKVIKQIENGKKKVTF